MKTLAAFLLILCGTAAGALESTRLRLRVRELTVFCDAVHLLHSCAAYTAGDLRALIAMGQSNLFLQKIDREKDPVSGWNDRAGNFFSHKADVLFAVELIDGFGRTDLDGLLGYLALFAHRAEGVLKTAEQDAAAKCRLFSVLGFFTGVSAALLLL